MKSGKRSTRSMLALPLAIAMVLGVMSSGPATAQVVGGASANLAGSDQQILAGGTRTFSITINQPSPTGCGGVLMPACPTNGVDYVSITAPVGAAPFTDLSRQYNVTDGSGPANWTKTIVPGPAGRASRTIIFQLPNSVNPDGFFGSQNFTVTSTVPTPGADLSKNWAVEVSRQDGQNLSNAPGNLTTVVRVLRVPTLELTGPTKAVGTAKVTGNQTGITVDCTVENIGSAALDVTPSLTAPGFTITGSPTASSVPAGGGTATYQFEMTANSVSSQTSRLLECNANGTNAEGTATTTSLNNRQLTIPVQPPAVFDYVKVVRPPTFSPRALAPESGAAFLATIRKNPSTSPGVDLEGAATKLIFKDGETPVHEIALGTALDVPAGGLSALVLTFGPTALPATMTPGQYDVSLEIVGEDKNGAPVSFVPVTTFDETLTIDAGIPLIENPGIIGVPKPSNFSNNATVTGDEGYDEIENAARKGTAIPVSGSVLDGLDSDSGEPAPCAGGPSSGELQPGECRVVATTLFQYSDYEGTIPIEGSIDCPSVSINSSGNFTGSCPTGSLNPETKAVRLTITVEDAVGLEATGFSSRLQVDQEIPGIASAVTARYTDGSGAERQNRLVVTFNECVSRQGGGAGALVSNANDWTVTDNQVESVQGPDCPSESVTSADPDGTSTITLTMRDDFDDDESGATVTYDTGCSLVCSASSLQDRVAQLVPSGPKDIIDGIAPKTPVITTASVTDGRELGLQDGEFHTNSLTPSFHIVNPADQMNRAVKAGYKVQIWEETNDQEGLQTGGSTPDTARSPLTTVDGDADCTGETNEVTGEVPVCELDVATDFSEYPSSGERALDVYVVSFDTRPATQGGPNISLPGLEGLNLDFSIPTLASVTPESGGIRLVFSESVPRGRDFAGDFHTFQDDGTRTTINTVTSGADFTERFLNISSGAYDQDHVGYVQYFYVGPATGDASQVQYEDRATNKTLTAQIICLQPGIDSGLCSA